MREKLHSFLTSPASVPWMLLLVSLASFGLLAGQLGFYWDDWEIIHTLQVFGLATLWDYFQGPRPLASWTYFVFAPLAGVAPLNWQVLALALRWLSAVVMARVFGQVWPAQRFLVTLAAVLFLVYPIFDQQPIAVSYHQHWLGYLLFFLSLDLMIRATRDPRRAILWVALAALASLLHLAVLEYFAGVELLRPLLLYLLPEKRALTTRRRLTASLTQWLPYLGVIVLFVAARLVLSNRLPDDTNRPLLLLELASAPLAALKTLVPLAYQDLLYAFFTTWNKVIPLDLLSPLTGFSLLRVAVGLALGAGLWLYLTRPGLLPSAGSLEPGGAMRSPRPAPEMMLVGVAAVVLGFLPAWIIYRQASAPGLFLDRYGLPAMFGAALAWVGFLAWLTPERRKQALLVAVLVGLAAGAHLQTANLYRWSWTQQMRVAWQLHWRAPAIQPDTVILSGAELFNYTQPGFLINTLYDNPDDPQSGMFYFDYLKRFPSLDPRAWQGADPLEITHRNYRWRVSGRDSLVLFYQPGVGRSNCLWLLHPQDGDDPYLDDLTRQALRLVNLERIGATSASGAPAQAIFGAEPARGWCYYYQKAELARQQADWPAIAALEDAARAQGFTPSKSESNAPHEWIPFILANGHTERWQLALEETQALVTLDRRYAPMYCRIWQDLFAAAPTSPARDAAYQQVAAELDCGGN